VSLPLSQISSLHRANSMRFLWVSLQLQQLCRTSRSEDDNKLKQALTHLPQGLAAMYTRIFNEISGGDEGARKVALECFRWMRYMKDLTSLDDLRVAVALLESPCTTEDLRSRLPPGDYIVEECRNLLQVIDPGTSRASIAPIHFSLLEYLQNLPMDNLRGNFWMPLNDKHDAESVLACRCMEWLLLALPEHWKQKDAVAVDTYLSYPTKFFDKHATSAIDGSCESPAKLLASINRLLDADVGKLDSLVKLRLMQTPLGRAEDGRNINRALSRNYLMWTSDLYLVSGLDSEWMELEVPTYALHLAVWFRPRELQRLLSNGHCVDEVDPYQQTPLSYACAKGCLASVNVLLRAGARLEADFWQISPLGFAIENNHFDLTKMLLKAKANIRIRPDTDGHIPLMMATSFEMVQLLCEAHDFDLDATDRVGRSILGYCVGVDTPDRHVEPTEATRILEYLIDRGADVYAKSKARMSVVDYAVCGVDGSEPVKFLLQHDPKLFDREPNEWTPLHWACRQGNSRTVKILLEHGSQVQKVTTLRPPQSWTPYEILMHYCDTPRGFDKSTTFALGRPKEIRGSTGLVSGEQIDYGSLETREICGHCMCSLCEM
jgi:hypothetical protein